MIALFLHATLVLATTVFVTWARPALAAWLTGCDPPPPPWRELRRLWRKGNPTSGMPGGGLAPAAVLALTIGAVLLIPSFALGMATAPIADIPGIFLLLASARVIGALAAVDASGAAGGREAGRAMLALAWSGPAVLLAALVLAGAGGSANLDAGLATLHDGWNSGPGASARVLPLLLAAVAVAIVGLLDEAPTLLDGLGGPSLAMARSAAMLRLMAWMSLASALAGPATGPDASDWALGAVFWVGKILLLTLGYAAWDAQGRRLPRPALAGLLALLGALLLSIGPGTA